ncbi:hypothetical protein ACEWY4_006003 [Coilia grayii]|uniref:Protein translocase subunit SecA n=1 Tax=Coilia grayii TaxID=363190 RepID=A0ABD1KCR7_9TELE
MRDEEQRRREEERKREEERRRQEERRREEERRIEEERRRQEERRIEEERRRQEERRIEERRQEKLNQRLQQSCQDAQEKHEKQLSSSIVEESKTKQHVLTSILDEFEPHYGSGNDRDELLEILSSKCGIPPVNLSLSQLSGDQLGSILSALDKLLFDEWISVPPSPSTLQHTQVFITELCALSLELSDGLSLQNISSHVQSLVESISQSACNVSESFLLTQALYLTLVYFFSEHGSTETDAVLIAKQWAEDDLSTEDVFLIEFLGTLITSLQKAIGRASVFILKMEILSLKLLLFTLTHLNGENSHSESTEMVLQLVEIKQWSPAEAVTLLKALSEKYAEDGPVTAVLTLVQVYDLSPHWTDDSGLSLPQAIDRVGPEGFQLHFQKTLRGQDERNLNSALAELTKCRHLDDPVVDMIRNITTTVMRYSENAPKDEPFVKDSIKCVGQNAEDIGQALCQLCKAVFDTKGWWPPVKHMMSWCVLVLSEKGGAPELVGLEEDPCVTAMFAAAQVCMGHKVDIVLRPGIHSQEQIREWSDFYGHLGISVRTNWNTASESQYQYSETDIVYGTLDDFVSDYFQNGLETMKTGTPPITRGFIIEERSLSASHHVEITRIKEDDFVAFAAEILQKLMGIFHSEEMNQRHRFLKALFKVLHTDLNKNRHTHNNILTVLKKHTGKELLPDEVYILTFLEALLTVFTGETDNKKQMSSPADLWCLECLLACAMKVSKVSKEQSKCLFQMVPNLVKQQLWSPVEALNLLVALTDRHQDSTSIMKILHVMETYRVSFEWTDEKEKPLLQLLGSYNSTDLIQYLEKSLKDEKEKSIETLFAEIRQTKHLDEETLEKAQKIVTTVNNLIESGDIKQHRDVAHARNLSQSTATENLEEILAVLCNAVHLCNAKEKWWPRANQMISWCILALSDTGKLLEMGTGEGKSCVIAMFAALRALRGEKVDVVSSSSVLCQRDAKEWNDFYSHLGITIDTNTNKTEDGDRKKCYQKDVVYGTIEAFAADHLRQIFEMKDVRPDRRYQCIIINEVDSLLLDEGVQLTYLSSPMVSMQHLNTILAMIWSHVSQYGFLSTGHRTFVQGPPASFFKAIFDSIDTDETEIDDAIDILRIAEESKIVPEGYTEEIYKSEKDDILKKLKIVSQDAVVDFFKEMEQYVPYDFTVYTLNEKGLLHLRKPSTYTNQDIPDLSFLVLGDGLCCPLYDSEESLIKPIAELISAKIQYTPCTNSKDKISIPGFLTNLIEKKTAVWVQNAFLAKRLTQGREYVVENDSVCPVDFRSTGIVELSKKWGDGLQQFVEIKHQIKLSTISAVTNYISNVSFFQKYHGNIYGTTGTLGSDSEMHFMQDMYPQISACKMPTFNRRKLFEVQGTLQPSAEEWKSEIKRVVRTQLSPNAYRGGRAALVICETINKAKEIYEELKGIIPGETILYCRSDRDSLSKIEKELLPGDVIVATNLAGRGTDIKVSKQVNNSGGLFVILSFLSDNTRVEHQAFGRTARKGKPGSAQIIMTSDHLPDEFRTSVSSLEEAKKTKERLVAEKIKDMMNDVTEMKLREDLFLEYCRTLQDIHRNTKEYEKKAVVAIMNEFWGIWLQTKSEDIDQLKRDELQTSLRADLALARSMSESQTSPCSSIYHYIKFGNNALDEKKWDVSARLFEKAMAQDKSWAAIAFYSHAYCTIKEKKEDYLTKARDDLLKAQDSLKYLNEECMVCLQCFQMSFAGQPDNGPTSLETQFTNKCKMFSYFDKNINEAIKQLEDIKQRERDAIAKKSPTFTLVSNSDEDLQEAAYNLYNRGLQYVFTVEEEPRFPWGALAVFILGLLQLTAGILLTVFTCGTLSQVGMGLITEGISDCISGVESMVTGEFSWKSWAIGKAISIGISLIGFGVGKLIAKGFKAAKMLMKQFGKQLKAMPKFLSRQAKDGLSSVVKTNLKNTLKYTTKKIGEELLIYGFGKAEEELLKVILNSVKKDVKQGIDDKVKSNMQIDPLASLVDSIILSHLEDKEEFSDLLQDENRKNKLLAIFRELSSTALQPFISDLDLQKQVNSSIFKLVNKIKSQVKGNAHFILTAIKTVHMSALAADATGSAVFLSDRFFSKYQEVLNEFKKNKGFSQKVNKNELNTSEIDMLRKFRQELADTISSRLADAMVEIFDKKFSTHIVREGQDMMHGFIRTKIKRGLKTEKTEERLKAGEKNRYIAYMPVGLGSSHKPAGDLGRDSQAHAEKIRKITTPGTILDVRVLSEATGTKVVILTPDSHGKLSKMQELNPNTKPASQTVTLIYRPKSEQYPDGHYDVHINNQTVSVTSKGKSSLFKALARGMKPEAGEEEIDRKADRLRSVEANTLLKHPRQWEPFIKRMEWTESIRGGSQYIAKRAAHENIVKENKTILKDEVGKVELSYADSLTRSPHTSLSNAVGGCKMPLLGDTVRLRQKVRIEEELGDKAKYAGKDFRHPKM